ncbi:hypothetical protein JW813_05245 [Clostridium botulinum]|uniref:hypothetical protein n=1 Tax=Clostridium botulinum TaxID=1491 RepID=UPI0022460B48|nr:hypothetical protein [Clostridium botulinum]UZP04414.1 hypothetical protein JW813_05245 [Clostridium botulinum]UZP07826.1 hypothetical protein JYA71_05520 [Clostridium botulinum]UZP11153.1 hypothetical protein JYA74_05240 [Clostridium botulinum]
MISQMIEKGLKPKIEFVYVDSKDMKSESVNMDSETLKSMLQTASNKEQNHSGCIPGISLETAMAALE